MCLYIIHQFLQYLQSPQDLKETSYKQPKNSQQLKGKQKRNLRLAGNNDFIKIKNIICIERMDLLENIRRLKQIKKKQTQLITQNQLKNQTPQLNNKNNQNPQQSDQNKKYKSKQEKSGEQSQKIEKQQNSNEYNNASKQKSGQNQEKKGQYQIATQNQNKIKQNQSQQNTKNQSVVNNSKKTRQLKTQQGGLFKGITFCFILTNIELSQRRIDAIRKNIQKNQGVVYQREDLQQLISQQYDNISSEPTESNRLSIDFVLINQTFPRQKLQAEIPSQIRYRDIINFNYVFDCISKNKILDYSLYSIPEKSKQLENYIKAKQAQKLEEMQNNIHNKRQYRYSVGIQPLQANKNRQPNASITQKSTLQVPQKKQQQKPAQPVKKPSFNKFVIQSFQKLGQLFEKSDRGRYFAYARIATVLKTIPFDITCQQDADKLQGYRFIGPKTIQKIKQFIQNGSIQKLTVLQGKQQNLVCQKLQKVWGIGKVRAQQLYNRGIKSVQQLRAAVQSKQVTLTKNQMIGLKYYEDLNQRIPRDKVTRMFQYIKKILFQIVGSETNHRIQVCGSYRRGIQTCGDIDVIITNKSGVFQNKLINNLVQQLTKQGFLTDHLAMPRHLDPKSCISYMGICKFQDEIHHRVDLKYYPVDQYAFAILYFTGSDMFNRNMRLYAMKNGFCLSDHRMCKAEKIAGNIVTQGPDIPCYNQEEIFQALGIKYKAPHERSL